MLNYRISSVQVFTVNCRADRVQVRLECDDAAVFECCLLAEGEGELKELSLSELEERALMYAADSFRYE
ncbi:hypothetical protein [Escherichia coli]|uniref:hypothetical protein n=1 Tax=Escherichia coli TaxID=562 RepID=UPI0010EE0E98|nr:hypothetical protein [Escherichia coli]ELU5197743.1 hypothetical protein [Escherichia coli]MBZ8925830.1 hypothetical protein [Escherichia coli]MCD4236407.1 hypothetical protein [Escherichia coli]GDU81980.1 hypothetical protein BvCmsSIP063_00063 [Escherichia coli]